MEPLIQSNEFPRKCLVVMSNSSDCRLVIFVAVDALLFETTFLVDGVWRDPVYTTLEGDPNFPPHSTKAYTIDVPPGATAAKAILSFTSVTWRGAAAERIAGYNLKMLGPLARALAEQDSKSRTMTESSEEFSLIQRSSTVTDKDSQADTTQQK